MEESPFRLWKLALADRRRRCHELEQLFTVSPFDCKDNYVLFVYGETGGLFASS